jgi:hypothetical protein
MTLGPSNAQSSYLPIEFDIPNDEKTSRELISKRERLTSSIVNIKENGQYETTELLTAQQWFNPNVSQATSTTSPRQPRYSFRKVFDFVALNGGPLLVATTYSFPHGITGITIPTRIFGTATTSTGKYYPLPFVSATLNTDEIEMYATATNVVIVTDLTIDGGANTLTQAYFVFEFLKT